jgi:ABC-type sugar transport system substrate-binding protein
MRKISRVSSIFLVILLVLCCVSACNSNVADKPDSGSKQAGTEAASGKSDTPGDFSMTIAYQGFDTGNTGRVILGNSLRRFCNLAGVNLAVIPDDSFDSDSLISFVETSIAAGYQGICICPSSDMVLLTVMELCEEAGVYWSINTRCIIDENVRTQVEASKCYVGNCYEDEYETSYEIMKRAAEMGYVKYAFISTAKGNTTCDTREEAMYQAAEDFGLEIVAEARDFTQPTEIYTACESFLAAYDDLDCIYIVGTYAEGAPAAAVKAIQDAGRDDVKLIAIDFSDEIVECFESGVLTINAGLLAMHYDPFISCVKVINSMLDTPISDKCFGTSMKMTYITNVEEAKAWAKFFTDETNVYMSDDEFKKLLKAYNKDLNADSFNEIVNSWNPLG